MIQKALDAIMRNKILAVLFVLATAFLIHQNLNTYSWDFNTYVLNAQYWFADGWYYEPYRPPLLSFLLGILSIFTWSIAPVLLIIGISTLHLFTIIRLTHTLTLNTTLYYALSLTPYALLNATINGTELASTALLLLAITLTIENRPSAGILLGLSALARYTSLALFPLFLFHTKIRTIITSLALFTATLIPWLLYNRITTGNMLTSIADQYANNILYRHYIDQPVRAIHLLETMGLLTPLVLIGMIIALVTIITRTRKDRMSVWQDPSIRTHLIMLILSTYALWSYANTPIKDPRYLYALTIPITYFAYHATMRIIRSIPERIPSRHTIPIATLLIFALLSIQTLGTYAALDYDTPTHYLGGIDALRENGFTGCAIKSNAWVMVNSLGTPSEPYPRQELIDDDIEQGYLVLLYDRIGEPSYVHDRMFLEQLPLITHGEGYILLGTGECIAPRPFASTYVQQINTTIQRIRGYPVSTTPCFLMFHTQPVLEGLCNLANLNGYTHDEIRTIP